MTRRFGPPPTPEDATLLLQLFEMRREPRMRDARRWFAASDASEAPSRIIIVSLKSVARAGA